VFDDSVGARKEVTNFLDSRPEILNWYTPLSNAVFIVSEETAADLSNIFRTFTKDKGRFLILDANTDRNGWLPSKAWQFLRTPRAIRESDK
jgi:hypothetical protein